MKRFRAHYAHPATCKRVARFATGISETVVFASPDLDEALRLGDRIAILRDGEVVQQGAREIVLKPADDYIESFVRDVSRVILISHAVCSLAPGAGSRCGSSLVIRAARLLSVDNIRPPAW
jgi:glycine betaine/proline transport system ATP-binding protein